MANRKKVTTYFRHVLPVFLAACLVVIALFPIYARTKNEARERVTQVLKANLENGLESITKKIDMLRMIIYNFAYEGDTLNLALLSDEQQAKQNYAALYHMKDLVTDISKYDLLGQQVIVQFRNNSVLLVNDKLCNDKEQIYGMLLGYEGVDYETWQRRLFVESERFWPAERFTMGFGDSLREQEWITMNQYYNIRRATSVVVSVLLPVDGLLDSLLPAGERASSLCYMTDSAGKVLYDSTVGQGEVMLNMNDGGILAIGDTGYLVFSGDSPANLRVAVAVPEGVLYEDVRQVMNMIYLFIIVALACAALYCCVYAYIYFRPIVSLTDDLVALGYGGGGRLYESLKMAIHAMNSDRQSLQRQVEDIGRRMEVYVLQRAVSGANLGPQELGMLRQRPVFSDRYVVMMLEYRGRGADDSRLFFARADMLMNFGPCRESIIEEERMICLLPYCDGKTEEDFEAVFRVLSQAAESRVYMACSGMHEDVSELSAAVQEAEQMIFRAKVAVKPAVFWYEAEPEADEPKLVIPFQKYSNLTSCLVSGDTGGAQSIFGSFREAVGSGRFSPERVLRAAYNLRDAVAEAAVRMEMEAVIDFDEENLPRMIDRVERYALDLCDLADGQKQNHSDEQMRAIMAFIEENYSSPGFCLTTVADEFQLSEKYLSRIIKKQTGKNFSTHIESLRMERAKRLLETTRMTIDEISAATGYEHKNTFYKAFKRYFGCVPNDMRQADQ